MNEYHQIKVLEMGISYLQKIRSGITDNLIPARGERHTELMEQRAEVDRKISALIDKRNELIMNTACSIADVEPLEV